MPYVTPAAPVFNINRASFHDGGGVRTVVYLKGCSLRCMWCHNPEGIQADRRVLFQPKLCIRCGRCVACCPEHHVIENGALRFVPEGCSLCLRCTEECPSGALSVCGRLMSPSDVFAEIQKDARYFEKTQGGATLSGGECLLYPDFALALFEMCRVAGIHTALESALHVPWENLEKILPVTDTLIADVKHIDDAEHKRFTGAGNGRILENLRRAAVLHPYVWLRTPLIPEATDTDENIAGIAALTAGLPGVRRLELLKYNPMGKTKYEAAGMDFTHFGETQSDEYMEKRRRLAARYVRRDVEVL
jgi:pyruvate formate lyase activating enzyme